MKIKEPFDLRNIQGQIYFMSDLHYNHANVLHLSKRDEFCDVYALNSYIEQEFQNVLKPEDVVFDLGDLFWRLQLHEAEELVKKIPTKNIYKIMGNHDTYNMFRGPQPILSKYFKVIADILEITVVDTDGTVIPIYMQHAPCVDYYGMYNGSIHLYGHTHGHTDEMFENDPRLMVDVGFDGKFAKSIGSFLISIDDVLDYFYKKTGGDTFRDWAKKNFN